MDKLEATFRIVTPMFTGGAEPNDFAELRPPSIKSAMRYWYRALAKDFREKEPRIFGGTKKGEGQSTFLLSIPQTLTGRNTYTIDKTSYFSFPFNMKPNKRQYIKEDQEFTLQLTTRETDEETRRAIVSSLWLLGHVGGLGSRSRRGFGTIALKDLKGVDWEETTQLTSAHQSDSAEDWKDAFQNGLSLLKKWYPSIPGHPAPHHLVLGDKSVFRLITDKDNSFSRWDDALACAAEIMRNFRDHLEPDYSNVKAHMCKHDQEAAAKAPTITKVHLSNAPERTAFGLPLTFRSSSLKTNTTFNALGKNGTRSGSRIFVRIIKAGKHYYPLFCRFNGLLLGPGSKITDKWAGANGYSSPSDKILDDFMNGLPAGGIISW